MTKVEKIVKIMSRGDDGKFDRLAGSMNSTKEEIVRRVLAISHGKVVRTHHDPQSV